MTDSRAATAAKKGKPVKQLKITGIDWDEQHGEHVLIVEGGDNGNPNEPPMGTTKVRVSQQWFTEHNPQVGGTYVKNDDGSEGYTK